MLISGFTNRRFKPQLHQYVVFLSKTLNPHGHSGLNCEMSAKREYPRDVCLFRVGSFLEDIALKNQHIFYIFGTAYLLFLAIFFWNNGHLKLIFIYVYAYMPLLICAYNYGKMNIEKERNEV